MKARNVPKYEASFQKVRLDLIFRSDLRNPSRPVYHFLYVGPPIVSSDLILYIIFSFRIFESIYTAVFIAGLKNSVSGESGPQYLGMNVCKKFSRSVMFSTNVLSNF